MSKLWSVQIMQKPAATTKATAANDLRLKKIDWAEEPKEEKKKKKTVGWGGQGAQHFGGNLLAILLLISQGRGRDKVEG